jgi:hypothetical protein
MFKPDVVRDLMPHIYFAQRPDEREALETAVRDLGLDKNQGQNKGKK